MFSVAVVYDILTAGIDWLGTGAWLGLVGALAGLSGASVGVWVWYVRSRRQ